MSYIIIPSKRRLFPTRPVLPNAPSIKSAYEGWVIPGFDFVNAWTKTGTPTNGAAASGLGTYFGSGNYFSSSRFVACGVGAGNERQYDSVWCVIFTPTSNAGNTGIFSVGSTATDGGPAILVRNNAGTINVTMAGAGSGDLATSVIGQTYCIVYTYNDVSPYNHKFFVNGVLKQTFAYYRSDSVWTGKNNYIASGYNGQFGGIVHGHFFFQPWTIGDADAAEMSANPAGELFPPDVRRIYFGAGATGGGNITFEALPSSLSLAGSLANLWANRLLTANPASFTFAGATASTLASRKVLANPSTLTMTGATGTLKWNRVFVASPGTLGFTGSVANFLLGKILTANPGSLNLTGATATVKKNSFIIADPGALSFVGQSAGLFRGRIMTADPGSLTLSGAVASLFHFRVLPADPGTLVLTGATATLAAPGTVQRARPSSDISSNGWLPSSGSDLYAMLDETSYNDSDYIYSPDNPTTQAAEVKFSAITDPGVNTGHVLRFRLAAVGQDTVFDVYLMCGATQIATWQKTVIAGVTTTYSETLTVGEAGNITDYSDLRIKVVAHA